MATEAQRREWREAEKARVGAMLAKAESYGRNAYHVAISLLDSGLSTSEILSAARKAPSGPPNDTVHRNVVRGDASLMAREDPEAEEEWLRRAREQAEREWASLYPQRKAEAAQLRNLRPSEIAFGQMSLGLARDAVSLRHHEGQTRYCGDNLDESLRRQGEAAAKRLWGGS